MDHTQVRADNSAKFFVPVVFTATIFLSASLLFFVQPLFAKIVLPQIGGAPAVWTTAMLFFQSVLIGGYLYAHLSTRFLPPRAQVALHLLIWASALAFLPLSIPEGWSYDASASTAWQTLVLFGLGVGVPFGVLSANAPLIQSWYSKSGGPSADDPYFLYSASNLGSLVALLAFPLVAEPLFGAAEIGRGWAAGFVVLGLCLAASGGFAAFASPAAAARTPTGAAAKAAPVSASRIGYWIVLAFVPSSMMLAVTTKISTDIGAIPLVWVIPLSLYLLSFVLTFTRRQIASPGVLRSAYLLALGVLATIFTGLTGAHTNFLGVAGLVVSFFAVALFAHRKLYESRPDGAQLTFYYVIMSVGGALGGLFNSIIAPVAFNSLAEGAVTTLIAATLVLSAAMRPTPRSMVLGLLAGAAGVFPVALAVGYAGHDDWMMLKLLSFAAAALIAILFRRTLPAAALGAGIAVVGANQIIPDNESFADRSFFGTHRVYHENGLQLYANGTTIHGAERLADMGASKPVPLFYYHEAGPLSQIMNSDVGRAAREVGIVGLGVGVMSCFRQPGQNWQFYEIDRMVDDIARNPALFTFMTECAGDTPTHLGDARVVLGGQTGLKYDVLVIDAYGSDAVPMHLTTHEAMELYLDRLAPDGLLVYHISNRYYRLEIPLARSADALGLVARLRDHQGGGENEADSGSRVVMLARNEAALGDMAGDRRWVPLPSDGGSIWTDDFANLLSILR